MIRRTIFTNCKNFERFHGSKLKKIKSKTKLSLASASPHGALASTRVILVIFTAETIVRTLLIAFWWLLMTLKSENRNFLEKHYAGARANIEQEPHGALFDDFSFLCRGNRHNHWEKSFVVSDRFQVTTFGEEEWDTKIQFNWNRKPNFRVVMKTKISVPSALFLLCLSKRI